MRSAQRAPVPAARRWITISSALNHLRRLPNRSRESKAYAIQAGRELRILVNNEQVTDEEAKEIAKGIAGRIEAELRYPGRIKVTIIRETRVTEYAR